MSSLPTPKATRLGKPSWKDARLVVGILLVLTSVVVGALAMSAADDRIGVWAAKGDLTPGQKVTPADLTRVDVQLGDGAASYLPAGESIPDGSVVGRPLRPGELVPRSALVPPDQVAVQPVAVHVDPIYLTNIAKGSRVGVYAAAPQEGGRAETTGEETPADYGLVLERVTVADIPEETSGVLAGGQGGASVIILVPREEVARILTLDTGDAPLKLVAESGSGSGS